jgi:hypothetical protein
MRSHSYDFRRRDLFQLIAPTLLPLTAFALVMHLGTFCKLLPKPRATLDVDRTILIQKAEASQSLHEAQVLLIGDSSCLIDVDARQLTEELKTPSLNLGTLSYLGLQSHAAIMREYFALNSNRVRTVVLLMHPEALRLTTPGEYHTKFLEGFLRGQDLILRSRIRDRVSYWLGFESFRNRLLARALPVPLGGAYGRRYGFSSDLEAYLAAHRGSLADPEVRKFRGNPEYRLASQFEKSSRAFRTAIPPNVKLLVAITPVPAGYAPQDYALTLEQILIQWQQWLAPATILSNVPAILPDHLFAKTTHLSEEGARQYTSQLAGALRLIAGEQ